MTGRILTDHEIEARLGTQILSSGDPIRPAQIQPASLDLRLGDRAFRLRAGFLPGSGDLEERVQSLATSELDLTGDGAVLERGVVYVIPLQETLALAADTTARFNPRSSTGRCDIFTRVLMPGHPRFDEAPPGYHGGPWLEVVPLSFPVRLVRGDRLCQLRLAQGQAALTAEELRAAHEVTPLCFREGVPVPGDELAFHDDGSIALSLGLKGRDPVGWRAAMFTDVVDFGAEARHARDDFWQPVTTRGADKTVILEPGRFYIFASRETLCVPPMLAAEMQPVDPGLGELRNNYAGFFDNGFGWREDADGQALGCGTPAVLEVRAHDMPFLVEDGQVFFRLRYFRTATRPRALYGAGRTGASYQSQDLTLARTFTTP